jgi:pimeloyl-ACP methyl ester carboxylesterase
MAKPTFDALFAGVPAAQKNALQRFWRDHSYTERTFGETAWRYIAMGNGRRLVVLLPHALFPADAWFMLASALQGAYRVLIPDGYAHQRMLNPVQASETLVQMIEAEGSYSSTFIAHSSGGSPAQWLLHRWPHRVQHLVLCHSPALAQDAPLPYTGSRDWLKLLPSAPLGERAIEALAPNLPLSGEWLAYTQAYVRLNLIGEDRRILDQSLGAERMMRVLFASDASVLQHWPGSLLAITARDDPFSAGSMPLYRERYPGMQATAFDAGGHWTPLLYPDLLEERVRRFLRDTAL